MAKDTGVTYYKNAQVRSLSDGSVYTLGMTIENLDVEVCGNTHPFYTGLNTTIDTAGRIDKFKARAGKAVQAAPVQTKVRSSSRKTRLTINDLASEETPKAAVEITV